MSAQIIPIPLLADRPLTQVDACIQYVKYSFHESSQGRVMSSATAMMIAQAIMETKGRHP